MEPAKLTMRAPDGRDVMVLERDRAQFEAQGYAYVGPFPDSRTKAAADPVSEPEPPSAPEDSAAGDVAPSSLAVESRAFEKPSRGTRARKG